MVKSAQLPDDQFKTKLASAFHSYQFSGSTFNPPSWKELSGLILKELSLRNNHQLAVAEFLGHCANLLIDDRKHKHVVYSNLFCDGFWRPSHGHPLWFYFAVYGLGYGLGGSLWIPDDEVARNCPELAGYWRLFPEHWDVFHLMAWSLLSGAAFTDDAIVEYTSEARPLFARLEGLVSHKTSTVDKLVR